MHHLLLSDQLNVYQINSKHMFEVWNQTKLVWSAFKTEWRCRV